MPHLSLQRARLLSALGAIVALLAMWWRRRRARQEKLSLALFNGQAQVYPQVTSFLTKHRPRSNFLKEENAFGSFCPCCRRPIEIRLSGAPGEASVVRRQRYAYVALIFGAKPRSARYALGALGLGQALKRTGSQIDRVLLHTSDVPAVVLEAVRASRLWKLQQIEYIHGSKTLGKMDEGFGWYGIFTKLRLFGLTNYSKVMFVDLDLLPRKNLDDLFKLEAPAAMLKATGFFWQPEHGDPLNGRRFFPTSSWNCHHGGINAGIMLFEPDKAIEAQMVQEVTDDLHPEHICSGGPEQEYLSRFFADRWRHIHSRYNFQLFRMDPTEPMMKFQVKVTDTQLMEEIAAAQFSSSPKPWDFADSDMLGSLDADLQKCLVNKWRGDGANDTKVAAMAQALERSQEWNEWPQQARVTRILVKEFLECLEAAQALCGLQPLQALLAFCAQAPESLLARGRPRLREG